MNSEEYDILSTVNDIVSSEEMKDFITPFNETENVSVKSFDYGSFINGLLNNPSTTKQDRERIVNLMLKERDKGFVTEEQVIQLIQNYSSNHVVIEESKEETPDIVVESVNLDRATDVDFKYKSPKDTHDFLVAYNQDSILKYTCHNIDDEDVILDINTECGVTEYDFEKHKQVIIKHFNQLRKGRFVDYRILNLISVYLTGKTIKGETTEWSYLKIKENWASEQLKIWAMNNPHVVPNPGENIASSVRNSGYKLPKPYMSYLSVELVRSFSDLVLYFKSLFHIKADNSLKSILTHINETEKYHEKNIEISFEEGFLERAELFAYVDALVQSYKAIIGICYNYSKKHNLEDPKIRLSFYEDLDNKKCFCIYHLNSRYGKTKTDAVNRIGEEQKKLIKNQINGLCDLYIQALFDDDFSYEINLWNGLDRTYKKIDTIQGVKYIMKFYI